MMREEAIQYAEEKYKKGLYRLEMDYLNRGLYQVAAREVDFLRVAIAALREKEERSKGCEYCNGLLKSDTEDFTMPNASKKEYDIVTIRFCPMCGRRLEEV